MRFLYQRERERKKRKRVGQIEASKRVSNAITTRGKGILLFGIISLTFFLHFLSPLKDKKMHLKALSPMFAGHQNRLFSAPSSSARGARARSKKAAVVVRAEVGTGRGVYSFRFRALLLLLLLLLLMMMMMIIIILVKSYSHFIQSCVFVSSASR